MDAQMIVQLVSSVATVVFVFATVKANQSAIIRRLDTMERHIDKAHSRIDQHIVDWHKE